MKNFLALLILVLPFSSLQAQTTYPSGATGCIARWTFDTTDVTTLTTLPDKSNNNNHATPHNITSLSGFKGLAHTAGGFDGSSCFADAPHNPQLAPTQITVVSLVNFNSFNSATCQGNNIVYKGYNYNAQLSWGLYVGETDNDCVSVNANTEKLYFVSPNSASTPPTSNFIQANKWYMLAARYDGSKVDYFQVLMDTGNHLTNLAPSYTNNSPTPLGNDTNKVFIGVTQNPSYKYWFKGLMDEVVLFNRALSDSEMHGVYNYLWGYVPASTSNLTEPSENGYVAYSNGLFTISETLKGLKELSIYNAQGQCVFHQTNPDHAISLSEISSGIYFAIVNSDGKSKSYKFSVVR